VSTILFIKIRAKFCAFVQGFFYFCVRKIHYVLLICTSMTCFVCGNKKYKEVNYNNHLNKKSLKAIAKGLLPLFEKFIPRSMNNIKKLALGRRYFHGTIRVCEICGHGYLVNPPNSCILTKYYKEAYWFHRSDIKQTDFAKNINFLSDYRAKQQIEILKKFCDISKIKKILEIGAGPANASLLLRHLTADSNINLFVYEPGAQWESYYGANNIVKIADYFPSETSIKFDYIHTSHWLEHTNNLDKTILEISNLLNTGAKVFVEVPNEEFYYWDLQIEDTPHLQFFTVKSLVMAFEKHGFNCLTSANYGISYLDRKNGQTPNEDNGNLSPNGFWIRALFEKK